MSAKKPTPKKSPASKKADAAKKDPTPTKVAASKKNPTPTKKAPTPKKEEEKPKEPEVEMEEDSEEEVQATPAGKGQKRKEAPQTTPTAADDDSEEDDDAPAVKKTKTGESTSAATRFTTSTDPNGDSGTIVLKGLSWKATSEDVKKFIEKSGAVLDPAAEVIIPKTPKFDGEKSRGFAFVTISTGLQKALALNGSTLLERAVQIEPRTNREPNPDQKIIFIEHFPKGTTDEELTEIFTKNFGKVRFARIK